MEYELQDRSFASPVIAVEKRNSLEGFRSHSRLSGAGNHIDQISVQLTLL